MCRHILCTYPALLCPDRGDTYQPRSLASTLCACLLATRQLLVPGDIPLRLAALLHDCLLTLAALSNASLSWTSLLCSRPPMNSNVGHGLAAAKAAMLRLGIKQASRRRAKCPARPALIFPRRFNSPFSSVTLENARSLFLSGSFSLSLLLSFSLQT